LSRPENQHILTKVKNHLSKLKEQVFKNKPIITTADNVLTLLSLQFSLFKGDFDKLSLDIKIKTFLLFFSRYVNRKEIVKRFIDFDEKISLTNFKETKQFLNG
jgi:hypothetical protein